LIAQWRSHSYWWKIGSADLLWDRPLVSSRLLECEIWNRINAHQLQISHGDAVRNLIGRVAMIEMVGPVLARALRPFPIPVRTLDAIHLSALEFIRDQKQRVELASYEKGQRCPAYAFGLLAGSATPADNARVMGASGAAMSARGL